MNIKILKHTELFERRWIACHYFDSIYQVYMDNGLDKDMMETNPSCSTQLFWHKLDMDPCASI